MSFGARAVPRSRGRTAGYTLIELMIVVMIVGVSLMAFAPGFGRAMADRQVSTAAREVIRIGRRARSETFGYLRAHLLVIMPTAGQVQLLRAPTNSCTLTSWAESRKDCATNPPGARCLENFKLADWSDRTISLFEDAGNHSYVKTARALCYAPSGEVRHTPTAENDLANVAGSLSDANTVAGGFVYALLAGASAPTSGGADRVHRVLFPLGGGPRSVR